MKKIVLFLATILGFTSANADGSLAEYNNTVAREQRIKEALETLIIEGVVSETENQCLKVDQNLLDQLKSDGTVSPSHGPTPQSICVVPK